MMFSVTTPKIHYFFDTEYDAVLFAKARSKKVKGTLDVINNKEAKKLYSFCAGKCVDGCGCFSIL
jgi:hypothetical protein